MEKAVSCFSVVFVEDGHLLTELGFEPGSDLKFPGLNDNGHVNLFMARQYTNSVTSGPQKHWTG